MRLEGNIGFFDKVSNIIYFKEYNIRNSDDNIWYKQGISIRRLINSNWLIPNIYHEINRE
jgi:hypothetical protein